MSIAPVSTASVSLPLPASNVKAPAKPVAAPALAAPAAMDSDGDHDGSVGTMINVKA